MARLKARGDFEWWLLSPDFTEREAKKLVGKCGIAYASESDCKNLRLHTQDKASIKEAVRQVLKR